MLPLLSLKVTDETGCADEELEVSVVSSRKNGLYHPGGARAFGYNPLGTTDFDELVSKSREMYPADVWVCTLRNNVLQRVVAGRPTVSARSTRYFVEIKAGYHTYHLDWDFGDLLKIAQRATYSRSIDTSDPDNKFKGLIYNYKKIIKQISCGWKDGMFRGGYERAQMSDVGLQMLARLWDSEELIEGVLTRMFYSSTILGEFIEYPTVKKAIGYAIMQGAMRAFGGSLESYVPSHTLYVGSKK